MIEKLEQLTVAQFVQLMCGDTSVLHKRHEIVTPAKLADASRSIILEYHTISDEAGTKAYIASAEELVKAKIEVTIYSMCSNLVKLGEHERARMILLELGINAECMSDQRITAEVKSRLERARSSEERIKQEAKVEDEKPSDIRRSFDEQTAILMTHFKFQIDPSTMKASIYAHLVARHNREISARLNAMKKK